MPQAALQEVELLIYLPQSLVFFHLRMFNHIPAIR